MRFSTVTLTGADYSVDPRSLVELSREFPFVEWGILFSKTRQDSPRYPSREWINLLMDAATKAQIDRYVRMKFAGHLCGDYSREFIRGHSEVWLDEWPIQSHLFERIQLNITDADFMDIEFLGLVTESQRLDPPWKEVIVQTKRPFERASYLESANKYLNGKVSLVYDASGGKGLSPATWPKPHEGIRCGYAGGISPQNVESVLEALKPLPNPLGDSWIDMETGVRDTVGFSIDHCREVLSKSRRYMIA